MDPELGPQEKRRYRTILGVLLAASFALRALLIWSGGQFFFPDESRYRTSRDAAKALWSGDLQGAVNTLRSADHLLFKVIGTLPASLEIAGGGDNPRIPALFFALFSVASLWLIWAIARRAGENERTAVLATFWLALASTFLYYSRHLLPYDMAMAFGLLALYTGQRSPARVADSIFCGFLASVTFLTYNGYWVLAGFAMLAHALAAPRSLDLRSFGGLLQRGLIAGASFVLSIAALLGADYLAHGTLLQQFVAFSGTVNQGSYAEGWSLPFEYLWHAEHLFTAVWTIAILFGCRALAERGKRKEALLLGLAGVFFVYGALVLFSVGLEKFVVYGRLARQIVPFCCLVTALFCESWWTSRRGRIGVIVLLALAILQTGFNLRRPWVQVFPAEFQRLASETAASLPAGPGKYEVLYAEYIWPEPKAAPEGGTTLLRQDHPMRYLPLQYEGYDPGQRAKLRAADISMRLVFLPDAPAAPEIFADGFEGGGTGAWSLTTLGAGAVPPSK